MPTGATVTSDPTKPSTRGSERPLEDDDVALLGRVADRVVELRMEVPAILTLETGAPLSVVAGQTLVFFEPFVAALLRLPDYRKFAKLVERRDVLERLTRMIEDRAEAAHAARKAEAKARREARDRERAARKGK